MTYDKAVNEIMGIINKHLGFEYSEINNTRTMKNIEKDLREFLERFEEGIVENEEYEEVKEPIMDYSDLD